MSIYSRLNSLDSSLSNLLTRNLTTAGSINVSGAITGSTITGSTILSTVITASNFSASSGFANLTSLTSSNVLISNSLVCSGNVKMRNSYGIDFAANTEDESGAGSVSSEVLDDYEEGTWTPAYSGSTTGGTAVGGTQVGYYTKVGRMVFINCFLSIGSWSTKPVGSIYISGLPFTINSSGFNYGAASATEFNSFATNFITILPKFEANSTVIGLIKTTAAATSQVTFLTGSDLSSATNQIIISGVYWT